METEQKNETKGGWPSSNYPIFLALVLLAATALTLAIGDETRAEDLAIYAYYFLVISVVIRFLELSLPEGTLRAAAMRISLLLKSHAPAFKKMAPRSQHLNRTKLEKIYVRITDFLVNAAILVINISRRALSGRIASIKHSLYLEQISSISRDVAILLSAFFLISVIYGIILDWWAVRGYLSDLVLIIFSFLALHILLKVRS
jgi:hypothetical protein